LVLKHIPLVTLLGAAAIGSSVTGQTPQSTTAASTTNDAAATIYGSWGFDMTGEAG
jgi:putative endopeptidase